jgi:hypothetical protein
MKKDWDNWHAWLEGKMTNQQLNFWNYARL